MPTTKTAETGVLNRSEIVDAAERETGHYGLVDAALLTRFGRLIDWINERGPYSEVRGGEMRIQIRELLSRQLRLAADRRRVSGIAAEVISRPLFVIGFPRTGTTLLHSLLAEDPRSLAPRSLHSHEPSPPPGEGPSRRNVLRVRDAISSV
jgi:Sulfotransferase family